MSYPQGLVLYHATFGVCPSFPVGANEDRFDDLCAQAATRGTPITDDDVNALFSDVPTDADI